MRLIRALSCHWVKLWWEEIKWKNKRRTLKTLGRTTNSTMRKGNLSGRCGQCIFSSGGSKYTNFFFLSFFFSPPSFYARLSRCTPSTCTVTHISCWFIGALVGRKRQDKRFCRDRRQLGKRQRRGKDSLIVFVVCGFLFLCTFVFLSSSSA